MFGQIPRILSNETMLLVFGLHCEQRAWERLTSLPKQGRNHPGAIVVMINLQENGSSWQKFLYFSSDSVF